ncbi:hypothetical protein ACEPAH_9225 [Sanghuangporus vaninii]
MEIEWSETLHELQENMTGLRRARGHSSKLTILARANTIYTASRAWDVWLAYTLTQSSKLSGGLEPKNLRIPCLC